MEGFCVFFFFLAYNQGRLFGCKNFVGFVYSQSGYMAIWWFLFRSNIEWPFVLQYSSSPLDFGLLPFLWVPSLVRSILVTLRQIYFCSALLVVKSILLTLRHVLFASLLMGALVGEVDFGDLEANLFFAVLFLW